MEMPLVSILLPNLNTRAFLEERMDSILNQTYSNWELIIADSYSDDGAWEYLSAFSEKDARITAYQIPKGLYQAWNFCIKQAKGKYIYIATSDDTMVPECIGKMVTALETCKDCDICDSVLKLIDEDSKEIHESDDLHPGHCVHFDFDKTQKHIRFAQHDFYLHLGGKTVYTSITQILIRKSLFEATKLFPVDNGCNGDFFWGLKAGLYANVIYLPEKLASWRIHNEQVTSFETRDKFIEMFKTAVGILADINDNTISKRERIFTMMPFKLEILSLKKYQIIKMLYLFLKYPVLFMKLGFIVSLLFARGEKQYWRKAYALLLKSEVKRLKIDNLIQYCNNEQKN